MSVETGAVIRFDAGDNSVRPSHGKSRSPREAER